MSAFLIQVSGHPIEEKADPRYVANASGPRFCDEPLTHDRYYNASPFWQREGFGRRDAWEAISPGDDVILYCSGSVDEHGACLSHILTVSEVTHDEIEGAWLKFSSKQELDPKIPYGDIQAEIEAGRFNEDMGYCGQEGFNITQIDESNIDRVNELADTQQRVDSTAEGQPAESLQRIADDFFGE